MIEAHELTECYGDIHAVHSLSVTIAPGTVTGFPGPNGAGKPATMRMIMGLGRPTSGTVTVNGKPYQQHRAPLREVRALLEASARAPRPQRPLTPALHGRHPQDQGLPGQRGHRDDRPGRGRDEARRRVLPRHGPAPGHRRRLPGDPRTLTLDEPVNGLPMWTGALSALPSPVPMHPEGVRFTPSQAKEVLAAISDALAGAELTVDQLTEAIAARRSW